VRKVVGAVRKVACFLETPSVVGVGRNSAGLFFLFAPRPRSRHHRRRATHRQPVLL